MVLIRCFPWLVMSISTGSAAGVNALGFFTYNQHDLRSPLLLIPPAVCIAIASLAVLLRLITKLWIFKQMHRDDYAIVLSWAALLVYCSFSISIHNAALGPHGMDTIRSSALFQILEFMNVSAIVYCMALGSAKLSLLLLFDRILIPIKQGSIYWTNVVLIVIDVVYYVVAIVVLIAQCVPRSILTDPTIQGTCINFGVLLIVSSAINVATDFATLCLPLWIVIHLQMPWKRKLSVALLFCVGAV